MLYEKRKKPRHTMRHGSCELVSTKECSTALEKRSLRGCEQEKTGGVFLTTLGDNPRGVLLSRASAQRTSRTLDLNRKSHNERSESPVLVTTFIPIPSPYHEIPPTFVLFRHTKKRTDLMPITTCSFPAAANDDTVQHPATPCNTMLQRGGADDTS